MRGRRTIGTDLASIIIFSLLAAACGGGGLQYRLYPEPPLPLAEESVLAVYERNGLLLLDGEDVATLCWGDQRVAAEGYQRNDLMCRLHIRPGNHTAVFHAGVQNRQRVSLDFTAAPGKVYGVSRSGCTASPEGIQQNCRIEIREMGSQAPSG